MKRNNFGREAKKQEHRVAKLLGGSRRGRSNMLWSDEHRAKQTVRLTDDGAEVTVHTDESLRPVSSGAGRNRGSADRRTTDRGDISCKGFHIEHKHTSAKSISITRDWLDKVSVGASQQDKEPALVFTFSGDGPEEDWAVVPISVFQRLTQ